jgi:GT2 family glycosyltransferase
MTSSANRTDRLVRPRHVVTAVLVAHDGGRWLPTTLHAVKTQRRPVQRFVAVDTGSHDDSRELLERAVGAPSVLHAPRDAGFGVAVALATAAFEGAPGLASTRAESGAVVEWTWLLHDDSAPSSRALEAMLELADEMPSAAIIGAKLRDWDDPSVLLEVGATLDRGGRRETWLEPGELDHGQHDGDRDVLAVSTAGMLVRRDVWDDLGGLDPELPLFRDDIDFGWRANLAGYRVVICTQAVVRHARAATTGRRRIACGPPQPRRLDRQGAIWTMLTNCPAIWLPWTVLRVMVACALRSVLFVLAKRPFDAWDEFRAAVTIFRRPLKLLHARKARKATRRVSAHEVNALLAARGTRLRRYGDSARERLADIGHGDDDTTDDRGLVRRVFTQPGLLLVLCLLVVSLVSERHVLSGAPFGGMLLPAPSGASDLWRTYAASWHNTGFGSTTDAPPYLAMLAIVATVLFGSAQLAVQVLLFGSVPIAGLTAYLASRPLATARRLRVWLAATYALLPVATGSIAAGRLGTAVAFAVLPLVLSTLGRSLLPPLYARARDQRATARRAGRRVAGVSSAWRAALLLAIATAFDPMLYVLLFPLIATALIVALVRRSWVGIRRVLIALVLPPSLLLPWSGRLWHHPALVVLGIGQPRAQLQASRLRPLDVLLLHPGGPGMPAIWVFVAVVLIALAGLLQLTRPGPARLGWLLVIDALVGGVIVAGARVHQPGGADTFAGWPGIATALLGAGLLMSAAVAGTRLRARLAQTSFGWRQPLAALLVAAAAATPLVAAAWWINHGTGTVLRTSPPALLPPFVAAESDAHGQARTVVLTPGPAGQVDYTLLRDRDPQLGDADLLSDPAQVRVVDAAVADLAAGVGQRAAVELAHAGIGYVLVPTSADAGVGARIAAGGGVLPENASGAWRVWAVQSTAGRVAIATSGDDDWQLPGDPIDVGRNAAPLRIPFSLSPRFLVLAEAPSGSWQAKAVAAGGPVGAVGAIGAAGELGEVGAGSESSRTPGVPLVTSTVGGMQAFVLPRTAADVVVFRAPNKRADWLTLELVILVVALLGAIPAGHRAGEEQRPGRPGGLGSAGDAGDSDPDVEPDIDPDVDSVTADHADDPAGFSPSEAART